MEEEFSREGRGEEGLGEREREGRMYEEEGKEVERWGGGGGEGTGEIGVREVSS